MNKFLKNRTYLKKWSIGLGVITLFFFVALFLLTDKAHADSVATVLKGADSGGLGLKIKGIWQIIINLCNGLIVAVLIFIAFAQILRLNINTYGFKKILPTLVLSIIAANFSLLFCRLLVDFASVLSDVFINGTGAGGTTSDSVIGAFTTVADNLKITSGTHTFGQLFWYGVGNLMIFATAVILLILAYLFIIRSWMIYFLVSIAPLAFMSLVLPQTKSLFNQWWSNFSKWVFMPIVSLFWIWLGAQWVDKVASAGTFMSFVFAGVCLYLAVTTPFKMGGAVMGAWGKLGKTAWGKTGGAIGKQVGWAASGGIASTMALRNQLRAKQLKSEGKDKEAKKYETKANRWTWVNPQALKGGIKGRIETRRSAIEGAAKKTAYYNRLLGAGATIRAGLESNKADWSVMSPEQIGSTTKNLLNDPKSGVWGKLSKDMRDRFTREALDPANAREMDKLGYVAGQEEQYAQHRFLQFMAKENPDALGNEIKLGSGEYFNLGNLQAGAQEYIRMSRGNPQVRERAIGSFVGTSAVGTPGSPQAQIQAAQQAMAGTVGAAAAQQMANAAAGGETYDEAIEQLGDKAIKVEIERFNPEAQDALRRSYGHVQTGNRQMESEEFLNEAGNKSEETAKIAGLIGKDGAQKLSALANHGDLNFNDALKSSGVDTSGLSEGAKKVLQDTYEGIQKSKNDMGEETYKSSQNEIEEELQGIKMVIDGVNHRGIRLGRMKSELEKSQEMFKGGDVAGAKSVIEGISGSLGTTGDANIEKALKKRMEHLGQGVDHFTNFDKGFANIADPAARRSAINESQKMLQVNPASYIADIREKRSAEAKVNAQATTATHIAASNLAVNPAVQNLPVAQIATNPVAIQELTNAISGLHQSLDSHGEQIQHLDSKNSSGNALNQVTKIDPISMGAKSMVVNSLNDSIQKGIIGAQTTVAQAFSNKEFRNSIAEGMKKALRETKPTNVPRPMTTQPPARTLPPTPPTRPTL